MNQTGKPEPHEHPSDGDVLLARKTGGDVRFTVSVVPGPGQIAFVSYRKALAAARAFARQSGTRLWIQQEGKAARRVRDRRAAREVGSAGAATRRAGRNDARETSS